MGRFLGVDPVPEHAESMGTYQYAFANPVMFNDPLGDKGGDYYQDPTGSGSGGAQAVYFHGGYQRISHASGNHWSNALDESRVGDGPYAALWEVILSQAEPLFDSMYGGYLGNDGNLHAYDLIGKGTIKTETENGVQKEEVQILAALISKARFEYFFKVSNVKASGLQIIQVYYGTKSIYGTKVGKYTFNDGKTAYEGFVDGGRNSPYMMNGGHNPIDFAKPYYWEKKDLKKFRWSGTTDYIGGVDYPNAVEDRNVTRFETIIVVQNYNNTGQDRLLGSVIWGWNSYGKTPVATEFRVNSNISPISINIIKFDYPEYKYSTNKQ